MTPSRSLQLSGTLSGDVAGTLYRAVARARVWAEFHRNVKPVDQRDVEEVQVVILVQGELSECHWRRTGRVALKEAAAVAGLTLAVSGLVEGAVGSSPDAALGCAGWHVKGPALVGVELFAAARHGSRPHRVVASVYDVEFGCPGRG